MRILRWVGGAGALVVGIVVVAELALQGLSLLAPMRVARLEGGRRVVLCVGDSHTYGALVEEHESYPAQLQARLDDARPGEFQVLNLGVPGMNSAQVARRLAENLRRYSPAMVLVWAGVNDTWNIAETNAEADAGSLWLSRSRLYRWLIVANHNAAIDAEVARHAVAAQGWMVDREKLLFSRGEVIKMVRHDAEGELPARVTRAQVLRNARRMRDIARSAGVPIAFLTYPYEVSTFEPANAALRESGSDVIETKGAVLRVPPERRELLAAAHPSAEMYREISADVASAVLGKAR